MLKTQITQDGSYSAHSSLYGESYHSKAGAYSEARSLYVEGCGLLKKAKQQSVIRILDIGFGLGYNVFTSIREICQVGPSCRIEIVSFEDADDPLQFSHYPEVIRGIALNVKKCWRVKGDRIDYQDERTQLSLRIGDARNGVRDVSGAFDAVFLDPFTPAKNPELWSVDFLRVLFQRMKGDGILSTYSVATPVIVGLREAGFYPMIRPGTATKRYSLVATRTKMGDLPIKFENKLKTSPERVPYRDSELSLTREAMILNREKEKMAL